MEMSLSSPPALSYLDLLNEAQLRAVLHGDGQVADPLLIIAGAGTGKTNVLAHRAAHLIVRGADPRRILPATFTRRAAEELTRRIQRIVGEVFGAKAESMIAGLTWVGTFHAIGTRLLREHAEAIHLTPDFTIHDREDSADLMNLVRGRMRLADDDRRFP
jgi:DNA helicase-2/ATP-dependent DNA helicase PcrA